MHPSPLTPARAHWTLDDIGLDRVEIGRVRPREELFLLLAGASLVEAGSDLYTCNLVQHFHDDAEVCGWLTRYWEPEELQHGQALRVYVHRVWPEFDWDCAFAAFFVDYSRGCTTEELEPSRCLEMAARCMVEMGTATYYRAIQALSGEPALARLAGYIERDEVRHYKHFLRYFTKYGELEHTSRAAVLGALVRRLLEMRRSDMECGAWHAFNATHPRASRDGPEFRRSVACAKALVRRHFPTPMAIKMFFRPLALPPVLSRLTYPAARLVQGLIMR